ncbi:MAG: Na/Pi cotransporter family protein [Chromatiales bacterium]|nr:Na/Pi cotransporter family protein [Chromatiales bacterium]
METQLWTAGLVSFAGGIGLFLLGMRLMTDGLKVAAGPALRSLLTAATGSPLRGLGSGVLITTLVQSSSAVIFATIGFVNAGLLTLSQSIGVIFGSNLGTTLTSWIVALIGFNVNLQALGLPAIAIGMGLWVFGGGSRRGALGQALAGFGLFFLGIDFLKDSFEGIGDSLDLAAMADWGLLGVVAFMLTGIVLTVLMQSSSAALAVTLTAAAGGLIPLSGAAAMVIGANVGTTSTAAFAVFGATPAAKRAAAAHVVFNLITAIIAFATLPLLLWAVVWLAGEFGAADKPATVLALFHTSTKLLGLIVIWPFAGRLVTALKKRFRAAEEDEALPRHLDRNILATPTLAMDAVRLELMRMGEIAHRMAGSAISSETLSDAALTGELRALGELGDAIVEFAGQIRATDHDPEIDERLPDALRVCQYYRDLGERAIELVRNRPVASDVTAVAEPIASLRGAASQALDSVRPDGEPMGEDVHRGFENTYQSIKSQLLRAGTTGTLSARRMVQVLDYASTLRRMVDQATKASRYLPKVPGAEQGSAPEED